MFVFLFLFLSQGVNGAVAQLSIFFVCLLLPHISVSRRHLFSFHPVFLLREQAGAGEGRAAEEAEGSRCDRRPGGGSEVL